MLNKAQIRIALFATFLVVAFIFGLYQETDTVSAQTLSCQGWTRQYGKTFVTNISRNVSIGKETPDTGAKLDVAGLVQAPSFQLPTAGYGAGKILTADASGNASWQNPPPPPAVDTSDLYSAANAKTYDGSNNGGAIRGMNRYIYEIGLTKSYTLPINLYTICKVQGCQMTFYLKNYDDNLPGAVASRGSVMFNIGTPFFRNDLNRNVQNWRTSSVATGVDTTAGQDGDGVRQDIYAYWGCRFHDGETSTTDNTSNAAGSFSLENIGGQPSPNQTCGVIIDP